ANIPQATLDRARRQAQGIAEIPAEAAAPERPRAERQPEAASRRYDTAPPQPGSIRTARAPRTPQELTSAQIEEIMAHPTKIVTEADLRAQYSFVLADLRSMGVLAAGLFATLVVLALIVVR
ncbi:MAG: hypothetical protein H7Y11_04145, partial [Armatimonadetes bacterium]|nr:hypothetical protein [Anaerolineae bacterium]